jgi:peptide/nickel transport system substrate-binding protein
MKRLIGMTLALAVALAACSKADQSAPASAGGSPESGTATHNSWTKPHQLIYADTGDINTLNTHLGTFADVQFIGEMTAAWLIRWDQHNNPYPELALQVPTKQNGGVSQDGLTITYHLRHGVKWSDGAPFDADDVIFSTKAVLNPANNEANRQGWDRIVKIDEPDKYTVIYHLSKPYSPAIESFFSTAGANPSILPKHLLAQYPNINHVPYNEKPIGIGPFKIDRWDRGNQVVMVPNPLYWRGQPKLQKIVFKIVPDRNTLLTQLQTHEVDLWPLIGGSYLARVQAIPGYSVSRQPSYVFNNMNFNLRHPALSELAVRSALLYALDREEIRQKIGHGLGTISDSPTPLSAPYAVAASPRPFDLAKANQMLDAAGWKRGADGVRAKNKVRLVLTLAAQAGSPDVDAQIELIRANWEKAGVKLDVRHYPYPQLFAPAQDGGIVYGDSWDVILIAWTNEAIGDYSQLYGCDAFPPAGQNVPRWCNKKAQAAMDALYTHYEQADRNYDVAALVREFVKDVPVVVTLQREDVYGYNSDLVNFHPNNVSLFDNMMDVDMQ